MNSEYCTKCGVRRISTGMYCFECNEQLSRRRNPMPKGGIPYKTDEQRKKELKRIEAQKRNPIEEFNVDLCNEYDLLLFSCSTKQMYEKKDVKQVYLPLYIHGTKKLLPVMVDETRKLMYVKEKHLKEQSRIELKRLFNLIEGF